MMFSTRLKSIAASRITTLVLRVMLGTVFLYAGIQKLGGLSEFALDIKGFELVPEAALNLVAAYLPFLEIFVGAALILRFPYAAALLISGGLLAAFLVIVMSALVRGLDVSCGCFGSKSASLDMALLRNAGLVVIWALLVVMFLKQRPPVLEKNPQLGRAQ